MEKNQPASQPPSLNAKELNKALAQAAKQASKIADAFGLKVPSAHTSSTKAK